MITVSHLTRRFGPFTAVDDVCFHVERGEVVGFLGPNGAGKTTTMRILTGYLPATSGAAEIAGYDVLRDSLAVRERIGYLPETVPLYREHRVEEMLRFQARLHRMPKAEAARRIPEVLERVGVLDRRRTLVGALSRGLRQRVGLAVALLPNPEVLILDEPTSGLDPLQRIEVRGLVQELAAEHTLLVSSHILPEIEAVCPRVIILHEGRVAADGNRSELVRNLGSGSHVRLELIGSLDAHEVELQLGELAGVLSVEQVIRPDGGLGFALRSDADQRRAVGDLAHRRGWVVGELSWREPSLEQLFSRIVFGAGVVGAEAGERPAPSAPGAAAGSETPRAHMAYGSAGEADGSGEGSA